MLVASWDMKAAWLKLKGLMGTSGEKTLLSHQHMALSGLAGPSPAGLQAPTAVLSAVSGLVYVRDNSLVYSDPSFQIRNHNWKKSLVLNLPLNFSALEGTNTSCHMVLIPL